MRGSVGSYYDVPATSGLGGVRALAGCGCGGGSSAVGSLSEIVKTPLGIIGLTLALALGVGLVIVAVEASD